MPGFMTAFLEMCAPILFTGENFRRETAQAKLNRLKELMK